MNVRVARSALEAAARHFEECGADGREGTGMLPGSRDDSGLTLHRFLAPDQRAGTFPSCWVEVTRLGQYQLAVALEGDERWLARIHSHPGEAFHSPIDDANPGLTADGALSIVTPYFGLGLRRGLEACAIYERRGSIWTKATLQELGVEVV